MNIYASDSEETKTEAVTDSSGESTDTEILLKKKAENTEENPVNNTTENTSTDSSPIEEDVEDEDEEPDCD